MLHSLGPFACIHLHLVASLFLHAFILLGSEVKLSCKSACVEAMFFVQTGTWNNSIFPSITPGWAVQSLEEGRLAAV